MSNQNEAILRRGNCRHPGDTDVGISYWWKTSARSRHVINAIYISSFFWLPATLLLFLGLWASDITASFREWRTAAVMWLAFGVAAFLLATTVEYWRAVEAAGRRRKEVDDIDQAQQALQTKADESEAMVAEVVERVARQLDPACWSGRGLIIRYPNARADQMSGFETDSLLVCTFGIFHVEVKGWRGVCEPSDDCWTISNGAAHEKKQSPLKQSEPKVRVLQAIAREVFGDCPVAQVHSLAVFTHQHVELPLTVPAEVLHLGELRYYLRTAYLSALKSGLLSNEHLLRFRGRLSQLHDARPDAKHHFMLELARIKGDSSGYLKLELRKQHLMRFVGLYPRPYWASPIIWVCVVAYLVVATWSFLPGSPGPSNGVALTSDAQSSTRTNSASPERRALSSARQKERRTQTRSSKGANDSSS